MAWQGTEELLPTDPGLRPGRQFLAGFAEGFGFSGLFAKLEQESLPFPDETRIEPDESDEDLANIVILLAKYEQASLRPISSSTEGIASARAAK